MLFFVLFVGIAMVICGISSSYLRSLLIIGTVTVIVSLSAIVLINGTLSYEEKYQKEYELVKVYFDTGEETTESCFFELVDKNHYLVHYKDDGIIKAKRINNANVKISATNKGPEYFALMVERTTIKRCKIGEEIANFLTADDYGKKEKTYDIYVPLS